jgi:hypothetical protein
MHLLSSSDIDRLALTVRPLLADPPWQMRGSDRVDTGVQAAFRRYRPGAAPHVVPPELSGEVWRRAWFPDEVSESDRLASVERAALVLHLLARNPQRASRDLGAACHKAGLTDRRFVRLMGTPHSARLESLSRLMQRLNAGGIGLRWASAKPAEGADLNARSTRRSAGDTRTDEVWPLLAFLFGYDADRSVARWAAGFFGSNQAEADEAEPAAQTATAS